MPGVLHDAVDDGRKGGVKVGIGKHDLRAFSAQLQRDRAMPLGGHLLNQGADAGAAGKADVVNARMAGECIADFVAVAGDDIERAGRKTDFRGQFRHAQQRQTSVFRRFDDADIARRQRAGHAAAKNLHRVVPRNDMAGHAVRLAPGHHAVAVEIGNGVAVQLVASAGVKLEIAGQRQRIGPGLLGGLAAVALLDQGQFFGMLDDFDGQPHQQPAAFSGAEPAPDQRKAVAGAAHCHVNIVRIAALNLVKDLAV